MKVPLKPLTKEEREALGAELRAFAKRRQTPGDGPLTRALAILWLQVCHLQGAPPDSAKGRTGPAWPKVLQDWAAAAAKILEHPRQSLEREWAEPCARLAAKLFEEEVRARREAAKGAPLALE